MSVADAGCTKLLSGIGRDNVFAGSIDPICCVRSPFSAGTCDCSRDVAICGRVPERGPSGEIMAGVVAIGCCGGKAD